MRIEANVTDNVVRRALAALGMRARDMRPMFAEIGEGIKADAQMRFKDSRDPYGQAWKPLTASTLLGRARRRAGKGGIRTKKGALRKPAQRIMASARPLLDTGRLRNSIASRLLGNVGVEVGTSVAYAAIHQFGGQAGRGRKVAIPARPFIATQARGLPREYGEIINDAIVRHFAKVEPT